MEIATLLYYQKQAEKEREEKHKKQMDELTLKYAEENRRRLLAETLLDEIRGMDFKKIGQSGIAKTKIESYFQDTPTTEKPKDESERVS